MHFLQWIRFGFFQKTLLIFQLLFIIKGAHLTIVEVLLTVLQDHIVDRMGMKGYFVMGINMLMEPSFYQKDAIKCFCFRCMDFQ